MKLEKDRSVIAQLIEEDKKGIKHPLIEECKKPPIKFVPHRDYGLKRLYQRLNEK